MEPGQVILFFIGLIVIIFAAYYVTYYVGLKASGRSRGRLRNKNINLIDRFSISKDKSFCLIEIAGKVYVVGITNQSMTLLDTLDAAAFSKAAAERNDKPQWNMMPGGRFSGEMTKKLAAFMAKKMGRPFDPDDNSGGKAFADSMKTAHEKNRSGQPDNGQESRADDPEDKV